MSEQNYKVLKDISVVYPVGRDNIPDQTFIARSGDIVKGSPNNDTLRVRAIYYTNGKYYNTPIFLPLDSFEIAPEKTEAIEKENVFNNQHKTFLVIAFLSITLALILHIPFKIKNNE